MKEQQAAKVRVCVRCRPLTQKEVSQRESRCILQASDSSKIVLGDSREFVFDKIYYEGAEQQQIFDECVRNLVDGCFSGFNASILAYGQTGSGKTYSMGSAFSSKLEVNEGIIPRSLRRMYEIIERDHKEKEVNLRISFLEIYNEEIRDLLHPDINSSVRSVLRLSLKLRIIS